MNMVGFNHLFLFYFVFGKKKKTNLSTHNKPTFIISIETTIYCSWPTISSIKQELYSILVIFDVAAKYLVVDCIMYEYVPTHDAESNQLMSIHNNFSFEFKSVRFLQLAPTLNIFNLD